uniref:Uncharacterized protein n=1 Tax=Arundo donax TaxID=35708 RepID=A0A0A9BKQ7_ARUDO
MICSSCFFRRMKLE